MGEKRGKRKIQIVFSNRWLYAFILLGILVIIAFGVNALNAGTKPNPGHFISELGVPGNCATNQSIVWNGTSLICFDSAFKGIVVANCPYNVESNKCTADYGAGNCDGTTHFGATTCNYMHQVGDPGYGGWCEWDQLQCTLLGYLVN